MTHDDSTSTVEEKEEKSTPEVDLTLEKTLSKIEAREKLFSDGWWKAADKAVALFNNEKEDPKNPYNILYSNTEVLKPSLYSATPKPDVRGRFAENPVSPLTRLVERFLLIFSDPANPGEESLDEAMSDMVTSALVSGMGFIRLRHYPKKNFPICSESGHYKGLIWPAGRKWSKLPWISFRHELSREEFFSQFEIEGEDRNKLTLSESEEDADTSDAAPEKGKTSGVVVYEYWDKAAKEIIFLCRDWEGLEVQRSEDALKLAGFFPTPGPLLLTQKPGRILPTPLYEYYRNQAEELNRVTARLNKVLSAIKVRGAYNGLLGDDLARILSDDDMENKLVKAEEAGLLMQSGGFEKQIWMLPLEQLITVATQLYAARLQIKQVIYELTGLSDIIRGSSVASETATAQNLKNKWGSIRLRDMQKSVAGYVRDLYRLAVDIGVEKIPEEQWKLITNATLPTSREKLIAQQQLAYEMAMQRPPKPELAQAVQSPSVKEVLEKIKSDANRAYTINVQSDSTIDLDTATDKAEVAEFMHAMGQLVSGLQPLATLGPSGLEAGKAILIAVVSKFKFGLSIVDSLKKLEAPPQQAQGPTPEQEQKDKDLQTQAAQLQAQEKQLQAMLTRLEDIKRDIEVQQKEFAADQKVAKAEMQAQQRIMQADQQVQQSSQMAKQAEEKATFVERKTELKTASAEARAGAKAQQKVQETATPVLQTMQSAMDAMAGVVAALEKEVQTLSENQKPRARRVRKDKDGSYIVE